MGADPNTYPPIDRARPDPVIALTIGEMAARRWLIRAVCGRCRVAYGVRPDDLSARIGADAFFWGRSGRCRVYIGPRMCMAAVHFEARASGGEAWVVLGGDHMMKARHLWKVRLAKRAA